MDVSKTTAEVLRYVLGAVGAGSATLAQLTAQDTASANVGAMLAGWVGESARFERFVVANRDKIRKKLRSARDAEAYGDVLAELAVARWLVDDRRMEVAYEPLAASGGTGPDFGVRFRVNTLFYVEVTRPRVGAGPAQKLAAALCTKLRQLQPSAANVVAVVLAAGAAGAAVAAGSTAAVGAPDVPVTEADEAGLGGVGWVEEAVRTLKRSAERREDAFFTGRGLAGARDFFRLYPRLSAVVTLAMPGDLDGRVGAGDVWINKETKHPLPAQAVTLLREAAGA